MILVSSPQARKSRRQNRAFSRDDTHTLSTASVAVDLSSSSLLEQDEGGDDWADARLQAEVQQASEQVWAEAEAWVEAEMAAEEQEWQLLAMGIYSYLKDGDGDDFDGSGDSNTSMLLGDYDDAQHEADMALLQQHMGRSSSAGASGGTNSAYNSPKQPPLSAPPGIGTPSMAASSSLMKSTATSTALGGASPWEGNFVALSPEQRAIWEESPDRTSSSLSFAAGGGISGNTASSSLMLRREAKKSSALDNTVASASAFQQQQLRSERISISTHPDVLYHRNSATTTSVTASEAPTRDRFPSMSSIAANASAASATATSHFTVIESDAPALPSLQIASDSNSEYNYDSPSPSPTSAAGLSASASGGGAYSASGGRSLHDKLSSPDRKKSISPTEALRRYEEKQINAEINRDKTVAERVQKAMIASQRVKLLEQREARRRSDIKQALEERLRSAEERHAQYLQQIKSRAFSQNSKVNEASCVNALNSEAIAQRLEEVEARILAASARRYVFWVLCDWIY